MLVYVLKQNGQPFMPTSRFGKVRRLLKEGKAKVVRREPFTIRLLYEPETDVVQECYCGVDTGSKHVGVAVVGNDRVLYQSQTELRDDIKGKMDRRRAFRRNRRNKKTRYRKCRFLNRGISTKNGSLPPSVKHKVQAHIDEIEFCKKILPISDKNVILEVSQFDTALLKNPSLISEKVRHWGYQKGFNYKHSSLTRKSCGKEFICKGKILGFKQLDKVEYFGIKCFINSRRSMGVATLVDIFENKLNFSNLPRGYRSPKMHLLRRLSSRRTVLTMSKI